MYEEWFGQDTRASVAQSARRSHNHCISCNTRAYVQCPIDHALRYSPGAIYMYVQPMPPVTCITSNEYHTKVENEKHI